MGAIPSGKKAPDFTLPGLDGKSHSVSNLKTGEVAVVSFYKATCPTCQFALPYLDSLYQYHKGDPNVRFLAVAQEDVKEAKDFSSEYKLTMPVALDPAPYKVSSQYDLTHVPTVFLIQNDGTVEQTTVGFVKKEYEQLAQKLGQATKKRPAPIFEGLSVPEIKPG
ncbi:MAG TPA: TlpA disulfide reductase family protein [Bdellovibrionota bacterium]|nr:TlpA disulfide reductase family protein [Bdellovibrionota bacterium]